MINVYNVFFMHLLCIKKNDVFINKVSFYIGNWALQRLGPQRKYKKLI